MRVSPRPRSSRSASVVAQQPTRGSVVVSGPYAGKRAAFTKDMSQTGRSAQSIATKIRMQSKAPDVVQQPAYAPDHSADVSGKWVSKAGQETLKRHGIELSVQDGRTVVTRHGMPLARIYHPGKSNKVRMFEPLTDVEKVDENGPRTALVTLGDKPTHDAAIEAVLRRHDIPVPGVRLSRSKESTAKQLADRMDPPVRTPVLKHIYGNLLKVHRVGAPHEQAWIDKHADDLSQVPEKHHQIVADYMRGSDFGGMHLGAVNPTQMKGTRSYNPAGPGHSILGPHRHDNTVAGVWYPDNRQLVAGGGTSGTESVVTHEFGHALDAAFGDKLSGRGVPASLLPHFQQVRNEVLSRHDNTKTLMNPYYTHLSSGNGSKEMWAQSYGAWVKSRKTYKSPDERALYIGHALGVAPTERLRVGRALNRYFEINDEKMRNL
jgi:hypothetical protein